MSASEAAPNVGGEMTHRHAVRFLRLVVGAMLAMSALIAWTLWAVATLGAGPGILVSWGPLWGLAARSAASRVDERREAREAAPPCEPPERSADALMAAAARLLWPIEH